MQMKAALLATAAILGLTMGAAQANLKINPNGGTIDAAAFENQLAGGPGFPLLTWGYQHSSTLEVTETSVYRFTYLGSGDSADTNSFQIGGGPFAPALLPGLNPLANGFLTIGPGGTTAGSSPASPVPAFFDLTLTAGTVIGFTFTNLTTGCTMVAGSGDSPDEACHYLIALEDSPSSTDPNIGDGIGGDLPQRVAFIGWSDLPSGDIPVHTGDHDFQDLTVRVERIPEPATLAVLGLGLAGLGFARRRRG